MSISKQGIVTAPYLTEFIANTFDTNTYVEPDGSAWIRIFHHNNPANAQFESTDSFTSQVYKDVNRWFNVSLCNLISGSWELMVKQKTTSSATETKYRWIQNYNPMIATYDQTTLANVSINTSSGYSTVTNYGGIYYKNASTYLCVNNANSSNWMGAIGSWNIWHSGIPGWGSTEVTSGYLDLYLRIDAKANLNLTSIDKNFIKTKSFNEI